MLKLLKKLLESLNGKENGKSISAAQLKLKSSFEWGGLTLSTGHDTQAGT